MNRTEMDSFRELETIPGVGPKIAADLIGLGIRSVADLNGRDPQQLYDELCIRAGTTVDRCMLYVFRCAVYYATNDEHDPALLKWWNWKDDPKHRPTGRDIRTGRRL